MQSTNNILIDFYVTVKRQLSESLSLLKFLFLFSTSDACPSVARMCVCVCVSVCLSVRPPWSRRVTDYSEAHCDSLPGGGVHSMLTCSTQLT